MKENRFVTLGIDVLLLLVLSTAFCNLGGLLGAVLGVFISAVLASVYHREHYSLCILSTLLVFGIITFFYGPLQMLYLAVPLVLVALSLHFGTKLRIGFLPLVFLCTVLFLCQYALGLKIMELTQNGVTFSSIVMDFGRDFQAIFVNNLPDVALREQLSEMLEISLHSFIRLAPAVFAVLYGLLSLFQVYVYKRIQQKRKTDMSFLTPFDSLQMDRFGSILFLILMVLPGSMPESLFRDALLNVAFILGFMLLICGVSFYDWKLGHVGMKKFVRRLILVILAFSSMMFALAPMLLLIGGGLLDSFFDFRHLRKTEQEL